MDFDWDYWLDPDSIEYGSETLGKGAWRPLCPLTIVGHLSAKNAKSAKSAKFSV